MRQRWKWPARARCEGADGVRGAQARKGECGGEGGGAGGVGVSDLLLEMGPEGSTRAEMAR